MTSAIHSGETGQGRATMGAERSDCRGKESGGITPTWHTPATASKCQKDIRKMSRTAKGNCLQTYMRAEAVCLDHRLVDHQCRHAVPTVGRYRPARQQRLHEGRHRCLKGVAE